MVYVVAIEQLGRRVAATTPGAAGAIDAVMALPSLTTLELRVGLGFGVSALERLAGHPGLSRLQELRIIAGHPNPGIERAVNSTLATLDSPLRAIPRIVVNLPVVSRLRSGWPGLVVRLN